MRVEFERPETLFFNLEIGGAIQCRESWNRHKETQRRYFPPRVEIAIPPCLWTMQARVMAAQSDRGNSKCHIQSGLSLQPGGGPSSQLS